MEFFNGGFDHSPPASASQYPAINSINPLNTPFIIPQQQQQQPQHHQQHQNHAFDLPSLSIPGQNWGSQPSFAQQQNHSAPGPSSHHHPQSQSFHNGGAPWQQQPSPVHHQHQHQHIQHQHHSMQGHHHGQQHHGMSVHQHPQQGMHTQMPSLLNESLRMSNPMAASPDSDITVARALYESLITSRSYRHALEGLHLVNGNTAYHWKDYYLEHAPRINVLVSRMKEGPIKTLKKPAPDSFTPMRPEYRNGTPRADASRGRPDLPPNYSVSYIARPSPQAPPQRRTVNSMSAPNPVYSSKLPAPNAEIEVPKPPSRSPTPPKRIEVKGGRNKYTPEDKEFFLKFIAWRLKKDPTLSRSELCDQLSEKAPQHSSASWGYHWQSNHDVADKIFKAAQGELASAPDESEEDDDDSEEEVITRTTKSRRAAKKASSPPDSPRPSRSRFNIPAPPSRSPTPPVHGSVQVVGRGNRYTRADDDYFIKFIGWRVKNDATVTRQQLCEELAEKVPHHTVGSWTSHWKRYGGLPDAVLEAGQGNATNEEDDNNADGSQISSLTEEESDASEYKSRIRQVAGRRRPSTVITKMKDKLASSDASGDEDADGSDEDDGDGDDNGMDATLSSDEKEMGQAGGPFTPADMRIAARHIAAHDNWNDMSSKARWEGFADKYPGRSYKSWTEYYRRMEPTIDKMANIYRKRTVVGNSIKEVSRSTEEATAPPKSEPEASEHSPVAESHHSTPADLPATAKRKLVAEDEENSHPPKQAKMDVEEPAPE